MLSKQCETFAQSQALYFQNVCFSCFNESPLKVMKNDFHFIAKALLVLRYLSALTFWSGRKSGLR